MRVGEVLGFGVGLLGAHVTVPDFGEQIVGLLAVVLEAWVCLQDAVELYLFGLGVELLVHRLREKARVLLDRGVDVEVGYGLERPPGVLQVLARLLEGVLRLGNVAFLRRGAVSGFDALLDARVGRTGLVEELVVLGDRPVGAADRVVGLFARGISENTG